MQVDTGEEKNEKLYTSVVLSACDAGQVDIIAREDRNSKPTYKVYILMDNNNIMIDGL